MTVSDLSNNAHAEARTIFSPVNANRYVLLLVLATGCGCTAQVVSEQTSSKDGTGPSVQRASTGQQNDASQDLLPTQTPPSNANSTDASATIWTNVLVADGQWIDLTHTFDAATIYWPTEDGFQLTRRAYGVTASGYFYSANRIDTAEHGGTHIDAPIHFFQDRRTVDQIPVQQLMGAAAVVDVTRQSADRDYQISVADLHSWEERHARQLVDVIVLLRTGYAEFWPDRQKYMGTEESGEQAVADLHFPGLAPEAAQWLVDHRSIKAIGIDTPSIDYGQSSGFQSHITLCEHNIPAFENVASMKSLPEVGATVIALPMKIGGGSGGPLRIVAHVPP